MKLDLITIGEFYNDFIFYRLDRLPRMGEELMTQNFARSPGGCAAITAARARSLGLRVGLVTLVGDPADLAPLRKRKIDTSHCVYDRQKRTALTVSFSTRQDRAFLTYEGANPKFQELLPWPRLERYLHSARHVHFAFVPSSLRPVAGVLRRLRAAGITASLDFGWRPDLYARSGFRGLLRSATIFFPNLKEAQAITGQRQAGKALAALAEMVSLPVLKLGGQGALGWRDGRILRAPAPRVVRIVDSTGAGDNFDAGFLFGYLRHRPLEECLRLGNFWGAHSIQYAGGIAPLSGARRS